jgi:mannose-6-phosphate isomerase-like protein (cupin superfamily)
MIEKAVNKEVLKGWGKEVWIVNNSKYCGKLLIFRKGGTSSMHYHLEKQETWYVSKGSFLYKYIDTDTADVLEVVLSVGDIVTNLKGEPHQLIALEDSEIFEVSTEHYEEDSYRVFKGDSQNESLG